jgi:NADH:ubiquinone oxidoreductase subunit 6 (subunit J)
MTERRAHLDVAVWVVVVATLSLAVILALIHTENATRDAQIADLTQRLTHAEALADRAVTDLTGPFEMSAWMFRCVVTPDPERTHDH